MAPYNIEKMLSPSELVIVDPMRYLILMNRRPPNKKRFKHNWRLDMLAVPKGRTEELELFAMSKEDREKYQVRKDLALKRKEQPSDKSKMLATINQLVDETTKHLSLLPPRVYAQQKKAFKKIATKELNQNWDKWHQQAVNSMYHEYDVAKKNMKGKKVASKVPTAKPKKGKSSTQASIKKGGKRKISLSEVLKYVADLAIPKKLPKPPKISRGKCGDVNMVHIGRIANPKSFTPRYVDTSKTAWRTQHFVPVAALKYQTTDRMFTLAMPKLSRGEPMKEQNNVEPNALHYKATPRVLELAIPKARSAVSDSDYNEDAFKIAPNALKYKATERIIELAKHRERS